MVRRITIVAIALLFVFGGAFGAHQVQTNGGSVETKDVRFPASDGQMIDATLYLPEGTSTEDPAPGVVAIHGYTNSKETMRPNAVELARRGMVVLAIDQTGHGDSDPPAFSNGFGGPPSLAYMQSLAFVDNDNIGLVGHSMGGWASTVAAATHQDGYQSVVLQGSTVETTGQLFGLPGGDPQFPRNLAIVFGEYDEFSMTMWGVPYAGDIGESSRLQGVIGTDESVEEGRTYGSVEDGTARRLYTPSTTHPGVTHSTGGIANTVAWMQTTLDGTDDRPPGNQIWWIMSLSSLLSMIGGLLFIFPFGAAVLENSRFASIRRDPPEPAGIRGIGRYIAVAVAAIVPVLSYYRLNNLGMNGITPSTLFPQQFTNGTVVWALGNALVIGVLVGGWHYFSIRCTSHQRYGFGTSDGWRTIAKSFLAAAIIVGAFYALLAAISFLWGQDFRFWVFAIKLPTAQRLWMSLVYFVPLTVFFLLLELLLHGQLQRGGRSFRRAFAENWVAVVGGFVVLYLVQYVPLFTGSPMPFGEALLTVISYQYFFLLTIAVATSTFFYRKTGRIWTGLFVNSMLITLIIVAGQVTHAPV